MTAITPYNPASPTVSLVTALAQTADLSDSEYRQIYDRVAQGRSLRNIELALRSRVTYGWWAAYAKGDKDLDRDRKNELRRWATANGGPELPDLPPTPVEAVAAHVHPDAAVYRVGEAIASRVVLVGADVPAANLRINGSLQIIPADPALESHQAACNDRYTAPAAETQARHRPAYFRPCLSQNPAERIPQLEALLAAARYEAGQ